MRSLTSLLLLIAAAGVAGAADPQIKSVQIIESGIYETDVRETQKAPGTATGETRLVNEVTLVQATTTIPARVGVEFGFRFQIIGSPPGGPVSLKRVNIIPAPGMRNPDTGTTTMREEVAVESEIGATTYYGYKFDNEWEIVPGTWTVEVWDGSRKLASQTFTITKQDGPAIPPGKRTPI